MKIELVIFTELSVRAKHRSSMPWYPQKLYKRDGIIMVLVAFYREKLQSSSWRGAPSSQVHTLRKPDWLRLQRTLSSPPWARPQSREWAQECSRDMETPPKKWDCWNPAKERRKTEPARKTGAGKRHPACVPLPKHTLLEFKWKRTSGWLWQKREEITQESREHE